MSTEDPITTLEDGGLTDLVEEFIGEDADSYVFDGQLGFLDYDMTFESDTQAARYEPLPYRVPDHDPVIVGLTFGATGRNAVGPPGASSGRGGSG